ncbi:acetylxylan esterase [Mucilaginibacter jinjuensis]|uniref:Acetylxylan esterase n=1 Tax=Mucilaginibacter jinjuensis TaxID=1176721 RepID=A0ABY7T7I7_9SPHI|nr:acetylxylan esterase [Mucilaginibacter jinjuensis]WCT11637.1 acetylxylan esterase [Mucilaginibacter jinjuensis]
MIRFLLKWIAPFAIAMLATVSQQSFAFVKATRVVAHQQDDEFGFTAQARKKDALFNLNEKVEYSVDIKNTEDAQKGTLGYAILSRDNKVLSQDSKPIELKKDESTTQTLKMPGQSTPGLYTLYIIIHLTDYDDTIRRAFAVDVKNIKSDTPKPEDFDEFWASTREELRKVDPQWKMTIQPNMEKDNTSVYLIEGRSLGNLLVRGWLTIKKNRKPHEKFPVWLVVPGYGGIGVKPIYGSTEIAVLSFNVRGQGNSRDVVHPTKEAYLTTDIENKTKYVYRGAIMDCIRAMDFISTRPELDSTNVIISGGSMGGYLAIAAASLDKRIKLCSANNPVFSDYRALVGSKDWPMSDFVKYIKARHVPLDKLLNVLDYYDLKNFAPNLKCPSLIGISLMDNLAPPYNQYVMLNSINKNTKYKLFVYPELGHEVPPSLFAYLSNWMMDQFAIF